MAELEATATAREAEIASTRQQGILYFVADDRIVIIIIVLQQKDTRHWNRPTGQNYKAEVANLQ